MKTYTVLPQDSGLAFTGKYEVIEWESPEGDGIGTILCECPSEEYAERIRAALEFAD